MKHGMVEHDCSPSTQDTEADRWQAWGQSKLRSMIPSQKEKKLLLATLKILFLIQVSLLTYKTHRI
jgi:hypothetical protein